MLQMCTSGLSKGQPPAQASSKQAMETCPHSWRSAPILGDLPPFLAGPEMLYTPNSFSRENLTSSKLPPTRLASLHKLLPHLQGKLNPRISPG